jgi:hypothetical protein
MIVLAVRYLPFDLVRHAPLMGFRPVKAERITSIVDELFVPLLNAYRSDGAGN